MTNLLPRQTERNTHPIPLAQRNAFLSINEELGAFAERYEQEDREEGQDGSCEDFCTKTTEDRHSLMNDCERERERKRCRGQESSKKRSKSWIQDERWMSFLEFQAILRVRQN
jgi:hypothetical protein